MLKREQDLERIRIVADGQSAIKMSKTEEIIWRKKHIHISYHYSRDVAARKAISFKFSATLNMVADFLTKAVGRIVIQRYRSGCGGERWTRGVS